MKHLKIKLIQNLKFYFSFAKFCEALELNIENMGEIISVSRGPMELNGYKEK